MKPGNKSKGSKATMFSPAGRKAIGRARNLRKSGGKPGDGKHGNSGSNGKSGNCGSGAGVGAKGPRAGFRGGRKYGDSRLAREIRALFALRGWRYETILGAIGGRVRREWSVAAISNVVNGVIEGPWLRYRLGQLLGIPGLRAAFEARDRGEDPGLPKFFRWPEGATMDSRVCVKCGCRITGYVCLGDEWPLCLKCAGIGAEYDRVVDRVDDVDLVDEHGQARTGTDGDGRTGQTGPTGPDGRIRMDGTGAGIDCLEGITPKESAIAKDFLDGPDGPGEPEVANEAPFAGSDSEVGIEDSSAMLPLRAERIPAGGAVPPVDGSEAAPGLPLRNPATQGRVCRRGEGK